MDYEISRLRMVVPLSPFSARTPNRLAAWGGGDAVGYTLGFSPALGPAVGLALKLPQGGGVVRALSVDGRFGGLSLV